MSKKGGGGEAEEARREERKRQERIRTGTKRVGDIFAEQFTPDFFNKQQQGFTNYALPQLDVQKRDADKQLTYALARSGNLESSARADLSSELNRTYGVNRQKIADEALGYKSKAINSVEDARTNLIAMLNATGDAEGAAQGAITRARALSQPPPYSPLANLFADFTEQIGRRAAADRAYAMAAASGAPGVSLYGGGSSVRVRG